MCYDILQISLRIKNLGPRESWWESINMKQQKSLLRKSSVCLLTSNLHTPNCFVVRQVSVSTVALVNQSVKKMWTIKNEFQKKPRVTAATSMSTRSRVKTMMNICMNYLQQSNIWTSKVYNNLSIYNNSQLSLKNYSVSRRSVNIGHY